MKRKKIVSTLAAMTMAATMGITALPVTALNVFAAETVVEPADEEASDFQVSIKNALEDAEIGTDVKNDVLKAAIEKAIPGYVATVSVSGSTAPTLNAEGTLVNGTISGSVAVSNGTKSESYSFTVDTDESKLTKEERLAIAKDKIVAKLSKTKFGATEKVLDATVIARAREVKDDDAVTVTNATVKESTDSTKTVAGKVSGEITLSIGVKDSKEDPLVEKTFAYTIDRELVSAKLTTGVAEKIANYLSYVDFKDDVTTDEIKKVANKAIADKFFGDINGVEVTSVSLVNQSKSSHKADGSDAKDGSIQGYITLEEAGTENKLSQVFAAATTETEESMLNEYAKLLNTEIGKIKATDIQKASATKAASENDVLDAVQKAIDKVQLHAGDVDITDEEGNDGLAVDEDSFVEATATKEGKATVNVTLRVQRDEWTGGDASGVEQSEQYMYKTLTFNYEFGKLKAVPATKIELEDGNAFELQIRTGYRLCKVLSAKQTSAKAGVEGNDDLVWESSDESVAIVDQNGKVTAVGVGSAVITVKSASNEKLSDSVRVTVKNFEAKFKDVQDVTSPYYGPIYWAASGKNAITTGVTKDMFAPDKEVTRAQMITFLYRMAGSPTVSVSNKFTDVASDSVYAKAIAWAVQNNITTGKTATTFEPNAACTRAQIVTFLYRYSRDNNENGENRFSDVATDSVYVDGINWAARMNITVGYADGTFRPNQTCTRAQAVTFLSRLQGYTSTTEEIVINSGERL